MSFKRFAAQQGGQASTPFGRTVVETDVPGTLHNSDWHVTTKAAIAINLPPKPAPGQDHTIAAAGFPARVDGNGHPIRGTTDFFFVYGDTAVRFVFTTTGEWLPQEARGGLLQSLATRLDTPASISVDTYTDLLSLVVNAPFPQQPGHKLLVWSSFSWDHDGTIAETNFRLIYTVGFVDTEIDEASGNVVSGKLAGALNGAVPNPGVLDVGTYIVRLQWKTTAGTATIDPADEEHASLIVMEVSR